MKKISLSTLAGLFTIFGFGQTTASNFSVNDCAGNPHTLFTELDAGTVVVLTWVMPCTQCISVASTAATTVQDYTSTYPGRVKFYLSDDNIGPVTTCSTLNGWASTYGISPNAIFSNAAISLADYGGLTGNTMQKTVVLGGPNHAVFYNVNGEITDSDLKTAINNALASTSGVVNPGKVSLGLTVFPSPASLTTKINYTLSNSTNVNVEIMNMLGEKTTAAALGIQPPGKHEYQINLEQLNEGIYFIKLNAATLTQTVRFTVVR